MNAVPSQFDVLLGRAAINYKLVSREQIESCLSAQRAAASAGKAPSLASLLLGRGLMREGDVRRIIDEIHRRFPEQGGRARAPSQAAANDRLGTATMRWEPGMPPPELTASQEEEAKETAILNVPDAARLSASSPTVPLLKRPTVALPQPILGISETDDDLEPAPLEPAPPDAPGTEGMPELPATGTPPGAERSDEAIRSRLGVPPEAREFDLGELRVLDIEAIGGMGVIYRCRDRQGNIRAAKAVLNIDTMTEKQLRRFVDEAQVMARLEHPNIVSVHDMGIADGVPYFVMDMLKGKDLLELLQSGELEVRRGLELVRATAEAVAYAHQEGVIHRDLKPSNIFVTDGGQPVLTDFGLAKNTRREFQLTATGAMIGTPLYLSPEQVAGNAHIADGRCDIYGLGVILYQVGTGQLPFVARNAYDVYKKIMQQDPTPPSQLNPRLPEALDRIVLKALAKLPEERYATAQELADDLGAFLEGKPVRAKAPPPGRRYEKETARERHKRATVELVASSSPPPEKLPVTPPRPTRRPVRKKKPRGGAGRVVAVILAILIVGGAIAAALSIAL